MKPHVLLLAVASYWLGGDSALCQPKARSRGVPGLIYSSAGREHR